MHSMSHILAKTGRGPTGVGWPAGGMQTIVWLLPGLWQGRSCQEVSGLSDFGAPAQVALVLDMSDCDGQPFLAMLCVYNKMLAICHVAHEALHAAQGPLWTRLSHAFIDMLLLHDRAPMLRGF